MEHPAGARLQHGPSAVPATPDQPSDIDVRGELARILASDLFSRSDRLSAFLTFIVEQTLQRHGAGLKEHVLAIELYGKDADFSTAADPIVRVDARRLRDKLREYYVAAPGDPVVISVPKGSYTPVFQRQQHRRRTGALRNRGTDDRAQRRAGGLYEVAVVARGGRRARDRRRAHVAGSLGVPRPIRRAADDAADRHVISWRRRHAQPVTRWQLRCLHVDGPRVHGHGRCLGEGGRQRRAAAAHRHAADATRRCPPGLPTAAKSPSTVRTPRATRASFSYRTLGGQETNGGAEGWPPGMDTGWSVARDERPHLGGSRAAGWPRGVPPGPQNRRPPAADDAATWIQRPFSIRSRPMAGQWPSRVPR